MNVNVTLDDVRPGSTGPEPADLLVAVHDYFDLMYDCDVSRLGNVFASSSRLHGELEGKMVAWTFDEYREVLRKRQSPKSLGAARSDRILLIDFTSPEMALVKVRVNIGQRRFVDYLTWHRIEGRWLITSKGYYIEDPRPPVS